MPIQLDTPVTVSQGHGQPDLELTHVMIIDFHTDLLGKVLRFTTSYGKIVNGNFLAGGIPIRSFVYRNNPEDPEDNQYDQHIAAAQASEAGALIYNDLANYFYQFLIDEEIYEGDIV